MSSNVYFLIAQLQFCFRIKNRFWVRYKQFEMNISKRLSSRWYQRYRNYRKVDESMDVQARTSRTISQATQTENNVNIVALFFLFDIQTQRSLV
jgi:hypothetical protein